MFVRDRFTRRALSQYCVVVKGSQEELHNAHVMLSSKREHALIGIHAVTDEEACLNGIHAVTDEEACLNGIHAVTDEEACIKVEVGVEVEVACRSIWER
jgi:hypothetical protein